MDSYDLDRPSLDRPSLDRIDALRARPSRASTPAQRPVLPWVVSAVLLAFALGLIANPWFERSIRSNLPGFGAETLPSVAEIDAQRATVTALAKRVTALEARSPVAMAAAPGVKIDGERLMRTETRLDGLEHGIDDTGKRVDTIGGQVAALGAKVDATAAATQATLATATQGADAAQAVLLLTTTRRLVENGDKLAAVEPGLQRAFGVRYPAPVAAVLALGAAPVTPRSLRADLLRLQPALTGVTASGNGSWWDGVTTTLSSIVRVRSAGTPPTDPAARVDAALAALAQNNVATATEQIAALPAAGRQKASGWRAEANRYLAGTRGLATLEAAALAPPQLAAVVPAVPK